MAIRNICGCEHQSAGEFYSSQNVAFVADGRPGLGASAVQLNSGQISNFRLWERYQTTGKPSQPYDLGNVAVWFAIKWSTWSEDESVLVLSAWNDAAIAKLATTTGNRMVLTDRDGVVIATTQPMSAGNWHWIGVGLEHPVPSATDGTFRLWVDDSLVGQGSGRIGDVDDKIMGIRFGKPNAPAGWSPIYDDMIVTDDGTAKVHSGHGVQVRMPDADGLINGWDPAVDFYANLDEIPEDGDATVIQTKYNADYFSVQFTGASLEPGQTLAAVKFQFMNKCPGILGNHSWQGRLYRPGSVPAYQAWTATSESNVNSYESRGQVYDLDPWTAAPWELGSLNNTQLGVWRYSGTLEYQKITQAGVNLLIAQSPFDPPDAKPGKTPIGVLGRIREDGVVAAEKSRITRV